MSLAIPLVTQRKHWSDWLGFLGLTLALLVLLTFLAAPLLAILQQAAQDDQGQYVGLRNFAAYLQTPAVLYSLWNSVWVSALVTLIVVPLAFLFAYALTRSCMRGKVLFRAISLIYRVITHEWSFNIFKDSGNEILFTQGVSIFHTKGLSNFT